MKTIAIEEDLAELADLARPLSSKGMLPSYIPALAEAKKSDLSVAIFLKDGVYSAGDVHKRFTLQSVSKILTLAMAIGDLGMDRVFKKVGMEPTGDPFNSIAKLENLRPTKPLNPMINAGALVITDMIHCERNQEKFERIIAFVRKMANNPNLVYNETVAESEFKTAFLNRALCYFLKEHQLIDSDVEELLGVYTKHCAIEMNCEDLAHIGFVLANDGIDPKSGQAVISKEVTRIVRTFMSICGMYNESGEFAIKVGIPAKSGVSGALLGVVPGRMGIGIYGPALNKKGNSIAGTKLMELLSTKWELNHF